MKKYLFLMIGGLLLSQPDLYSQTPCVSPFCQYNGPPFPGGLPGSFNGNTPSDFLRSIGVGKFLNTDPVLARLHVRNDFLYDPTNTTLNGKLFRTDGNVRVENSWAMWTTRANPASPFGATYSEIFKLYVPPTTSALNPINDLVIQTSQTNGNMKFYTGGGAATNFRGIITSAGLYGINTLTPKNRLEINSAATDPTPSGLRLTNLTTGSTPIPNPHATPAVLSVDANGDVILVPDATGGIGAITCAQNGLNCSVTPGLVEMGGNLIRPTNVTMHDPLGLAQDMVFNGIGQFGVGNNLSAGALANPKILFSNFHNGTNNVWNTALEVDFTSSGSIGNTGVGILSDVKVTGFSNFPVSGVMSNVLSDAQQIFGYNTNVTPASNSGAVDAFGINAGASNAAHNWGGNFAATTTLNTVANTWSHGIEALAVGGSLEAVGGLFYADQSVGNNFGVYTIARNSATTPGSVYAGLKSIADVVNPSSVNYGVEACAQNDGTGVAIAVRGTLSQAQVPLQPISYPNAHIAIFGDATDYNAVYGTPGAFPASLTRWAGYFNGDVNINGLGYITSGVWIASDNRYKKDIKKLENVTDRIKKLNGYTYNFKTDEFKEKGFDKKEQIGLIAQELKEAFPQLVKEDKEGYFTVNYQGMIPVLLEAVKEQQSQIEKQTEAINNQQKQIDELKELVKASTANGETKLSNASSVELSDKNAIVLNQNVPNPFAESTVITYNIPSDFNKAQLIFSTNEGKVIKVVDVREKGQGTLNVFANDLSSGLYSYSLVVDGKTIDTKKMVKN